jgi:hypothetical protein
MIIAYIVLLLSVCGIVNYGGGVYSAANMLILILIDFLI